MVLLTPRISPASRMKNSKSLSLHLFVNYARRIFSDANWSSKSNNSSGGTGNSLRFGGNTAGTRSGSGASNYGGIKVSGSCFTPMSANAATVSGIMSTSNLKSSLSNMSAKLIGTSSLVCKQLLRLSAIP